MADDADPGAVDVMTVHSTVSISPTGDLLSRGHVTVSRAFFDRVGSDRLAAMNTPDRSPPVCPDVTVVEPDGSLIEIEGSGP